MKSAHQILTFPLITEKSTLRRQADGIYCFRAHVHANKIEIAKAVEELFGVKVADVRTARVKGKVTRMGRFTGRRAEWKKAWVRLAEGQKEIEFFEAS